MFLRLISVFLLTECFFLNAKAVEGIPVATDAGLGDLAPESPAELSFDLKKGSGLSPIQTKGFIKRALPAGEHCFFTPWFSSTYESFALQRRQLDRQKDPLNAIALIFGTREIQASSDVEVAGEWMTGALYKVRMSQPGDLTLSFDSLMPHYPFDSKSALIARGFYPLHLRECPASYEVPVSRYRFMGQESVRVTVRNHSNDWKVLSPTSDNDGLFLGQEFSFAVVDKTYRSEKASFGEYEIQAHFNQEGFVETIELVKHLLEFVARFKYKFPHKSIHLIESDHLETDTAAGLLVINRSAQAFLNTAQRDWTRWFEWVVVTRFFQQIFGSSVVPETFDDRWVVYGLAQFMQWQFLEDKGRERLFRDRKSGHPPWIDYTFSEIQQTLTAVQFQGHPQLLYVDENGSTVVPFEAQSSLHHLRQTLLLRYLSWYLGRDLFIEKLLRFATESKGNYVSPASFKEVFPKMFAERQGDVSRIISELWSTRLWPDYRIVSFKAEPRPEGGFTTRIVAELVPGDMHLDVPVLVRTATEEKEGVLKFSAGVNSVDISTKSEPLNVEIDAERVIFDRNRFNNHTRGLGINFFPGNATKVSDDDYTALWLPFPFRRPGEGWSIGFIGSVLKFFQRTIFFRFEQELQQPLRNSYSFSLKERWDKISGSLGLASSKDYLNAVSHEVFLERQTLWFSRISSQRKWGLGFRQVLGKRDSKHPVLLGSMTLSPAQQNGFLNYQVTGSLQGTQKGLHSSFGYLRSQAKASFLVKVSRHFNYSIKGFMGHAQTVGNVPPEYLIDPQAEDGAGIRLDERDLLRGRKIYSVLQDVYLPIVLPALSKSVFLTERLRWFGFYDFGQMIDLRQVYRSAGFGLNLPLGGDITGIGTLAVASLRFTVVVRSFSEYGQNDSTRYLFALSTSF